MNFNDFCQQKSIVLVTYGPYVSTTISVNSDSVFSKMLAECNVPGGGIREKRHTEVGHLVLTFLVGTLKRMQWKYFDVD